MRAVLIAAATLALALGAPAPAHGATQPAQLTLEADEEARQGDPHEITVRLSDASGAPLAGRTVAVRQELRFFDYRDEAPAGEVRTDYRGVATLTHTPTLPGRSRLIAEFAGDDDSAAATATATIAVEEGVAVGSPVVFVRPEPLLPRGVTAVWFVPLLLGVWLAISFALYQLVRIPAARARSRDA